MSRPRLSGVVQRLENANSIFLALAFSLVLFMMVLYSSLLASSADGWPGFVPLPLITGSSVLFLEVLGIHATASAGYISLGSPPRVVVDIISTCTGVTLETVFIAGIFFAFVDLRMKKRLSRRLAVYLLVVGTLGMVGITLARVFSTLLVGYAYGPGAMDSYHAWSGTVMLFVFVFVFWFYAARMSIRKGRRAPPTAHLSK